MVKEAGAELERPSGRYFVLFPVTLVPLQQPAEDLAVLYADPNMMISSPILQKMVRMLGTREPQQHISIRCCALCSKHASAHTATAPCKQRCLNLWPLQFQGDRFKLATQAFDRQYAHIYFQRLMLMKPPLLAKVRKKWPGIKRKFSSHFVKLQARHSLTTVC